MERSITSSWAKRERIIRDLNDISREETVVLLPREMIKPSEGSLCFYVSFTRRPDVISIPTFRELPIPPILPS